MQDGMEMDHEALRREASRAVSESDYNQTKLSNELGVSTGAISRALSESGPKFSRLQREVLEKLTPFRIEKRVLFKAEITKSDK